MGSSKHTPRRTPHHLERDVFLAKTSREPLTTHLRLKRVNDFKEGLGGRIARGLALMNQDGLCCVRHPFIFRPSLHQNSFNRAHATPPGAQINNALPRCDGLAPERLLSRRNVTTACLGVGASTHGEIHRASSADIDKQDAGGAKEKGGRGAPSRFAQPDGQCHGARRRMTPVGLCALIACCEAHGVEVPEPRTARRRYHSAGEQRISPAAVVVRTTSASTDGGGRRTRGNREEVVVIGSSPAGRGHDAGGVIVGWQVWRRAPSGGGITDR